MVETPDLPDPDQAPDPTPEVVTVGPEGLPGLPAVRPKGGPELPLER